MDKDTRLEWLTNDRSCCYLCQIRQRLESGEDVFYMGMTLSCEEGASYHTPISGVLIIEVCLTLGPDMDLVNVFFRGVSSFVDAPYGVQPICLGQRRM